MKKSDDKHLNWRPTTLDLAINNYVNEFEQRELQGEFKSPVLFRVAEKERNRKIIMAVLKACELNAADIERLLKEK